MKKLPILLLPLLLTLSAAAAMRPAPEYLKRGTVYQVVLRTFTRDGSFKAATKMLEHVRATGVDVVYLAPFVAMDCDMDRAGWSPRQIRSGFGSPKNPYRISDYDRIDPEYGTDADFRTFNDKAHALGMKVYMDLVYLHCGPNNVLKDKFPDAFQRNPDGTVKTTIWRFPFVNFASKGVQVPDRLDAALDAPRLRRLPLRRRRPGADRLLGRGRDGVPEGQSRARDDQRGLEG